MDINERLQTIIDKLYNGKQSRLADAIGVAPSVIANVVGKRQGKPSFEILKKICANANISADWLISGRGDMVLHDADPSTVVSSGETRPRIPLNAAAGVLTSALDGGTLYQCEQIPVVRAFSRYDFTVLVNGDSMLPQIHSGDELACLNISSSSYIQPGRTYLLDTAQGIVVKVLYDNDDFSFLCHSENPAFSDFTVPRSDVFSLALVIGLLRRF